MDDNRIKIVASLDIPESVNAIGEELEKEVAPRLNDEKALKIVASLNRDETVSKIQAQLSSIAKDLKLDIGNVQLGTGSSEATEQIKSIGKAADEANKKIEEVGKTLANIDTKYLNPFSPQLLKDGRIDADATIKALEKSLSPLGTVTAVGHYDDKESVGALKNIEATIINSNKEMRKLKFEYNEFEKKFYSTTGTYSDSGILKQAEQISKFIDQYTSKLNSLKSSVGADFAPNISATLNDDIITFQSFENELKELRDSGGDVETLRSKFVALEGTVKNLGSLLRGGDKSLNQFTNAINNARNFSNEIKALEISYEKLNETSKDGQLFESLARLEKQFVDLQKIQSNEGFNENWITQYRKLSIELKQVSEEIKLIKQIEREDSDSATQKQLKGLKEIAEAYRKIQQYTKVDMSANTSASERKTAQSFIAQYQEVISTTIDRLNKEGLISQEVAQQIQTYDNLLLQTKEMSKAKLEAVQAQQQENDAIKEYAKEQKKIKDLEKQSSSRTTLENRIAKTAAALEDYANKNNRAVTSTKLMSDGLKTFAEKWQELLSRLNSAEVKESPDLFKHLNEEIATFKKEADAANLTTSSLFRNMRTQLSYVLMQWVSLQGAIRVVKSMVEEVKDLDTAMINLRKVTDETDQTYREFISTSQKQAAQLHATTTDIVTQSSEWAKLGYNLKEAQELTRTSMIYSRVGEVDNATAVSDLVTVLKAFNKAAEDSIETVDALNDLGNKFATDAKSLGEGLSVSASALAMAGNDINQSLALITGGAEITQNARETGNAIKVISLRIRGMKGALEELNEETEGLESISKIQTQILNITKNKVNIFNDNGSFRSTYEILKDISEIYDSLSDPEKANITEILFGKVRANQGLALIQAFQSGRIEEAYNVALNSAGSAQEEFDKMSEGIEAHIKDLRQAFETLSKKIIDSGLINFVVDSCTKILNLLSLIIDRLGVIPTILAGLSIYGSFKGVGRPFKPNMPKLVLLQFNVRSDTP